MQPYTQKNFSQKFFARNGFQSLQPYTDYTLIMNKRQEIYAVGLEGRLVDLR